MEDVAEVFLAAEVQFGVTLAFAPTPADAVAAFDACGSRLVLRLRPDGYATCRAVLEAFARWSDRAVAATRGYLLSSPTHEAIAREVGRSVRTVSRYVRLLHRVGFMVTVVAGSTRAVLPEDVGLEDLTAAEIEGLERERSAAVYLLTVPYELLEYTPSGSPVVLDDVPVDRDGDPKSSSPDRSSPLVDAMERPSGWVVISGLEWGTGESFFKDERGAPRCARAPEPAWVLTEVPRSRRDRLRAVKALQAHSMVLRRAAVRDLHATLRPFFDAEWSLVDVLHALDARPDGVGHLNTDRVRHAAGWLASRLAYWMVDGLPVASYSQQVVAEREAMFARRRRERAEREARARLLAEEGARSTRTSFADHLNRRCWRSARCSWCDAEAPTN